MNNEQRDAAIAELIGRLATLEAHPVFHPALRPDLEKAIAYAGREYVPNETGTDPLAIPAPTDANSGSISQLQSALVSTFESSSDMLATIPGYEIVNVEVPAPAEATDVRHEDDQPGQ